MKRLAGAGGAALVAAATVGVIVASSGTAQLPTGRTIKFTEKGGTFAFVDNPPRNSCKKCAPRPSAGDSMVFTANLFDEANKRIGTLHGACAFTRGGRISGGAVGQCNLTVHLADGSMAVSALVNFGRKTIPFSVTGGTGAYEGVRGSGTSTERGKGEISDDVIHLLP